MSGVAGGIRTRIAQSRQILSLLCIPVPPQPQTLLSMNQEFLPVKELYHGRGIFTQKERLVFYNFLGPSNTRLQKVICVLF